MCKCIFLMPKNSNFSIHKNNQKTKIMIELYILESDKGFAFLICDGSKNLQIKLCKLSKFDILIK